MVTARGNRLGWHRCGVIALLAAGPALGQQASPTSTAGGEPVTLAYKFRVGDKQTWKQTAKSDLTVTPFGAQVHEPQLPMTVAGVAVTTETITEVKEGAGIVRLELVSDRIRSAYLGKIRVTTIRNGKGTVTIDGKPLTAAEQAKVAPRLKQVAADRVLSIRRDPRGVDTPLQGGKANAGSWGDLLVLPDKPVQVGETWTQDERFRTSVSTPVGREFIPETGFHFTFTLKSVENAGGKHTALVVVKGASTPFEAGKGAIRKFSRNYDGTCRFDIDRGVLVSGQFTVDTNVTLAVPAAERAMSAFAPEFVRIDGLTELSFNEAAAAK